MSDIRKIEITIANKAVGIITVETPVSRVDTSNGRVGVISSRHLLDQIASSLESRMNGMEGSKK